MNPQDPKIKIQKNGPILVSGNVPLRKSYIVNGPDGEPERWERGLEYPLRQTYTLCRCGRSKTKPYCDGAHTQAGFDGTETAGLISPPNSWEKTEGPALDLGFSPSLCAAARFCHGSGDAWTNAERSDDPARREIAIRETADCPSGSLVAWDKNSGKTIEPEFTPAIDIVEDPPRKLSGPLWIKGGIPILSAGGAPYEIRNRVTLCRCGSSENKPFCDGAHCDCGFNDGYDRVK